MKMMKKNSKKMEAAAFLAALLLLSGLAAKNVQAAVLRSFIQWAGTTDAHIAGLEDGNSAILHLETQFTVADGTDVVVSGGPYAWYQHYSTEYGTTGVTTSVSGQNNDVLTVYAYYDLKHLNGKRLNYVGYNTCDIYGNTSCGFDRQ